MPARKLQPPTNHVSDDRVDVIVFCAEPHHPIRGIESSDVPITSGVSGEVVLEAFEVSLVYRGQLVVSPHQVCMAKVDR